MELLSGTVEPSWIDYNGHMNVAYYHMAFDRATDRFLERVGLGEAYVESGKGMMFALEDHLTYQSELRLGDGFRVTLQFLDLDEKRLHYFLRMFRSQNGKLAATCEHLSIYVDMASRRAAPLPSRIHQALARLLADHRKLAPPEEVGRPMGVRRPPG